jgi:hypothetical protein
MPLSRTGYGFLLDYGQPGNNRPGAVGAAGSWESRSWAENGCEGLPNGLRICCNTDC